MNPLPEYLPSNLTAEETLRALEPCFPPALRLHLETLTTETQQERDWAQEEVEEAQGKVEALEEEKKDIENQRDELQRAIIELDGLFTDLLDLIPKTRRERAEVTTFATTLAEALSL